MTNHPCLLRTWNFHPINRNNRSYEERAWGSFFLTDICGLENS